MPISKAKAVSTCIVLLALAACEPVDDQAAAPTIECAINGASAFAPDCTMERAEDEGASILIVRHPDGAFRRFELGVPGEGIITADGMQPAEVERGDGMIEVRVGADRYRLPVNE